MSRFFSIDDFVFDTQMIAQALAFGFRIAEIAVPTRYAKDASSVNFRRSVDYGLLTLVTVGEFVLNRAGWKQSRRLRVPLRSIVSQHYHADLFRDIEGGSDGKMP